MVIATHAIVTLVKEDTKILAEKSELRQATNDEAAIALKELLGCDFLFVRRTQGRARYS